MIAIFRVIYLIKVDMEANVTGTMATTVLLFTLEPNLAILAVSIPMLRPLYARYRKRNQSSRLYDDKLSSASGGGLRTIGGGGHGTVGVSGAGANSQAQRSRFAQSKGDPLEETVWEMDRYRPAGSHETKVDSASTSSEEVADNNKPGRISLSRRAMGDDESSLKSLTSKSQQQHYGHNYLGNIPTSPMMPLPSSNVIGVKTTWTVTRDTN